MWKKMVLDVLETFILGMCVQIVYFAFPISILTIFLFLEGIFNDADSPRDTIEINHLKSIK